VQIEQELNLVMESTEKKANFIKEWSKYAPAIILYGRQQTNRTLMELLRNFNYGMNIYSNHFMSVIDIMFI